MGFRVEEMGFLEEVGGGAFWVVVLRRGLESDRVWSV